MRDLAKVSVLLLIVGVLWIAAVGAFFVLYFVKAGMLPLALPVGMLALGAAFLGAFFYFRRFSAERGPEKKEGKRK